jgi:hypothetical protein
MLGFVSHPNTRVMVMMEISVKAHSKTNIPLPQALTRYLGPSAIPDTNPKVPTRICSHDLSKTFFSLESMSLDFCGRYYC